MYAVVTVELLSNEVVLKFARSRSESVKQLALDLGIRWGARSVRVDHRHGYGNAVALVSRLLDGRAGRATSTRYTQIIHRRRGCDPGLRVRIFVASRPYRGEQDADDVDVVAHHEHVHAIQEARVAKGDDEQRKVEDDGEDEVGGGDPEECRQRVVVVYNRS